MVEFSVIYFGRFLRNFQFSGLSVALWRTAPGDAVLERSIENRCIKKSEGPATQHANLGTKQVVSLWFSWSTLCRQYITISICTIFYPNSLNIQNCVSQHSRESNGVGLRVVMRITSHNYDVTNVCPDSIVCAWQPPAGCPRRHLKSNTCVRRNFKHTKFNLFLARLIK